MLYLLVAGSGVGEGSSGPHSTVLRVTPGGSWEPFREPNVLGLSEGRPDAL